MDVRSGPQDARLSADELRALWEDTWFRSLPLATCQDLLQHSAIWHVPPRHVLSTQGSAPDVWFGIAAGAVKLSACSSSGRESVLDVLEPGQWFGDVPLLSRLAQPYTAQTGAPSTLLVMRRTVLQNLLKKHADLHAALARLTWRHSERLIERLGERAEPSLPERARRQLQLLAKRFGINMHSATQIGLVLTQAELGAMLGASRQRVNQVLQLLERAGEIRLARPHIYLLDTDRAQADLLPRRRARVIPRGDRHPGIDALL
jgi:CRP/FNR family transcriptional regulator, cyclic AMP receptor protein